MNDAVPQAADAGPDAGDPQEGPGASGAPQPPYDDGPAGPAPLGVPRTPTGNAEVDAHVERLADADHLTTDGHLEVYEDVHRGLRDALTALDARPGPSPAAPHRGPSGRPSQSAHGHRS
ncbi:hypothetical protein [Streptomyces sp. MA15]|uniref:hypothetical protein n=1 Tax=unclassified Streptomyces TaxID=2593676 RepID=UPI0025B18FF8|nr:hypothetical protein [Streptomyces sp. MA15]MDN3269972.1 hypothetical protein [Streptomyces sp. MA15]